MIQRYALSEVTAPATEPVTAAEFKLWSRIDTSADDTLIASLITAARRWCEDYCDRAFINTTFDLALDSFRQPIRLPRAPLSSVTSISYVDTAGSTQVLSSSVYRVDSISEPARITLAYAQSWPSIQQVTNAVTIRFVAGYGSAASDVPEGIKTAIKEVAASLYEQREQRLEIKDMSTNVTAVNLLETFRLGDQEV